MGDLLVGEAGSLQGERSFLGTRVRRKSSFAWPENPVYGQP